LEKIEGAGRGADYAETDAGTRARLDEALPNFGGRREARRANRRITRHIVDAQIGRVLDSLQSWPARETIVVFWSDHGYDREHGSGSTSCFEDSARVP